MSDEHKPKDAPPAAPLELVAQMDRADAAFKIGNFAAARVFVKKAQALAASAGPEDRERLARLQWRLRPDPLAAILIAACLILFVTSILVTAH